MIHLLRSADNNLYPAKIEEELGLTKMSAYRALPRLEERGFVKYHKIGPITVYDLTELGREYAQKLYEIRGVAALYNWVRKSR